MAKGLSEYERAELVIAERARANRPSLEHRGRERFTLDPRHASLGIFAVIPVNIGWDRHGGNNMGAGLALAAATAYPRLPAVWGEICQERGPHTPVTMIPQCGVILFPVKPLKPQTPADSWNQKADPFLIERSARQLSDLVEMADIVVSLPHVGCGNGGLALEQVDPLLHDALAGKERGRVTLVSWVRP